MDFGRDQSQEEGKEDQGEVKELAPQLCQGLLVLPQKEGQEDKETFLIMSHHPLPKRSPCPPGLPSGSGLPGNPSSYPQAIKLSLS